MEKPEKTCIKYYYIYNIYYIYNKLYKLGGEDVRGIGVIEI